MQVIIGKLIEEEVEVVEVVSILFLVSRDLQEQSWVQIRVTNLPLFIKEATKNGFQVTRLGDFYIVR